MEPESLARTATDADCVNQREGGGLRRQVKYPTKCEGEIHLENIKSGAAYCLYFTVSLFGSVEMGRQTISAAHTSTAHKQHATNNVYS